MTHKGKIIRAEIGHVEYVAAHMRQADIDEIRALGADPAEALLDTFENSLMAWAWMVEGHPAVIFGINATSFMSDTAVPWMITTAVVEERRIEFLRACRREMDTFYGTFPRIVNVVDDRHVVAKRWLEWLGFELSEPTPLGPQKLPFRCFELRRHSGH